MPDVKRTPVNPILLDLYDAGGQFVGFTLRDLFAGFALVGLIAHPQSAGSDGQAEWAYKTADEMLAEREKFNANGW